MNVYCSVCGSEMEIMTDLISELRVYPCGCGCNGKQKRQPTQRAADLAVCTCPKVGSEIYHVVGCPATFPHSPNQ